MARRLTGCLTNKRHLFILDLPLPGLASPAVVGQLGASVSAFRAKQISNQCRQPVGRGRRKGGVIAMRRRGLHKLKIDIYHLNGQRSHPAAHATYKYGQACPWSKHNFMQK